MKIFQIGFNKCGTSSLYKFFLENGINSIHWDRGKLAAGIDENYKKKLPLLGTYEAYQFFSDMEFAPTVFAHITYYKLLDQQYPGSKFILNLRDKKAWLLSRCRTNNYLDRFQKKFKLNAAQVIDLWSQQWDNHLEDVRRYFSGRNDLLEFHIDTDPASKLIEFFPELNLQDKWEQVIPKFKA